MDYSAAKSPLPQGKSPSLFFWELIQELLRLPSQDLAKHVIQRICSHYNSENACFHLNSPFLEDAFPGGSDRCPIGLAPSELTATLKRGEASWGRLAARKGQPVSLAGALATIPDLAPMVKLVSFSDGLSVPILYHGEYLGIINVYLPEGTLTPDDVYGLANIGGIVYGLVKRTQMIKRVESLDDAISALAISVEARDPYTGGHLQRVQAYVTNLAKALSLPEEDIRVAQRAAVLHDLGKIGVPDAILTKPASLIPAEWEAMKRHPAIGEEIFRETKDPDLLKIIPGIRWHHERPDGLGYPDGLRGETIPTLARIIAVADAYDALTSDRPYRQGLDAATGLTILVQCAGSQFNRKMVQTFLDSKSYRLSSSPQLALAES